MTAAHGIVLVYGEEREARMAARRELAERDYAVRVASSMAEASKAVAAGSVSLVVLVAGGTDATALAARLQAAFTLPVIQFESGNGESITERVRTAIGAHAVSRSQVDGASE